MSLWGLKEREENREGLNWMTVGLHVREDTNYLQD